MGGAYTCGVNLILSGRGVDLDDRLREYATEKLSRVEKFFDRIIKMEIELRHERNPRVRDPDRVEVVVKTPGETLRVHGEGADHFAAIDLAADRLERRVKRFKNRLIQRARNGKAEPDIATSDDGRESDGELPIARFSQQVAKPLTPEEALLELDTRGLDFMLFTNAETMQAALIYRRDGGFGLIEHEG
jgi:putative sigma-54 modulation protein